MYRKENITLSHVGIDREAKQILGGKKQIL
jgi:hypothetical protein